MPKLHEIIAVAKGKKCEAEKFVTDAYHKLAKPELFDSMVKTYRPAEENGEALPSEKKIAQEDLPALVREASAKWAALFDLTLTLDVGNQKAKADIVVNGVTLATGVPVPTLLFLEKQLENVKAFVSRLPTPDPSETWRFDPSQSLLAAEPTETFRTKKVQKALVMYAATTEHPAQTQLITEDVVAGYWRTSKFTSRVPASSRESALERVSALLDAVKVAREQANGIEVEPCTIGTALLKNMLGDLTK